MQKHAPSPEVHHDAARTTPTHGVGRVLVIDDDAQVRELLTRLLTRAGHACSSAGSGSEATELLARDTFDVALCDVQMPGESGIDLITRLAREHPDMAAVMVSGRDDRVLVDTAFAVGAYGYVTKPFKHNDIIIEVANALQRRELERENRSHRDELQTLVDERTASLQQALKRVELVAAQVARSREDTIQRLSRAVEFRDEETGGHVERMSRYCELLAKRLDFSGESIRIASPMHDVGKIAVSDAILRKPGKLTAAERREMERHCEVGYDILKGSGSKLLDLGATIALTHHERVDGTGYPHRLSGGDIPVEGRIAGVADVFDALTTDRVYRPAFNPDDALAIMRQGRGTQFDATILDTFTSSIDEVLRIKARLA